MSALKKLFKIKFWNKIKTPCIQNLPNQQLQWIDCKFFHLIYFSQESPQDNDLRQTLMISLPEIQYWKYCEKITPPSFYIDILFDIAYAPNYNAFSFCYFLSNKFSEYIIVFIHLNISAWYRKLLTSSSQQLAEWEKASIASHKRCAAVIRKSSS